MQGELCNNQFIYNECQAVILKLKPNEEKTCILRITVETKINHTTRVLYVKVTDDVDHTFLFTLILSQEDFMVLKAQQGLRVDFENFHKQFSKLLSECGSSDKPQFTLMLDDADTHANSSIGGLYLKVIERNDFKYLCHLSLRLAPASDEDIKNHLCSKVKILQDQISLEKIKCSRLQNKVTQYTDLLSQKSQELKDLEVRQAKETSTMRLDCNQEVSKERAKYSNEISELEAKHKDFVHDLQEQIRLLTFKNTSYHEERCSLQSSVKEATLLKENATKDLNRLITENAELKGTITNLELRVKSGDQRWDVAQRRIAAVEAAEKEASAALTQLRRDMQALSEREAASNSAVAKYHRRLQQVSQQLVSITKERDCLLEEIDLKRKKIEKVLLVGTQLEAQVNQARTDIGAKDQKLVDLEKSNEEFIKEVTELKGRLNDAEEKLRSKEETVKKQEDVISYLNRRLNENTTTHLSLRSGIMSTSASAAIYPNLKGAADVRSNTSRTAVPWMTSNMGNSNNPLPDQSSVQQNDLMQFRLDPSYLSPADTDRIVKSSNVKKVRSQESAYFPKKLT